MKKNISKKEKRAIALRKKNALKDVHEKTADKIVEMKDGTKYKITISGAWKKI